MKFLASTLFSLALAGLPSIAYAQDCPEIVNGRSMADLIAMHGSAEQLHEIVLMDTVLYELFIEDLEADLVVLGPDPEIEAELAELRAEYNAEHELLQAAWCHSMP
jgi:hypothetical protein